MCAAVLTLTLASAWLPVRSNAAAAEDAPRSEESARVSGRITVTVASPPADGRDPAGVSIHAAAKVWSVRGFVNDLRRPRPPRQRSERPTTGADGIEAMMTSAILRLMLQIDMHRPFVSEADAGTFSPGHYRSLLRPPSALS